MGVAAFCLFVLPLAAFAIPTEPHNFRGLLTTGRRALPNRSLVRKISSGSSQFTEKSSTDSLVRPTLKGGGGSEDHDDPKKHHGIDEQGVVQKWRQREAVRIIKFAAPALSITLADPLMSCVDAICVGQSGTTLQLAALGPNLVIFNFINYTFQFLAIATTLRVASCLAAGERRQAARTITIAAQIAAAAGVAIAAALFVLAEPALGCTGAVRELVSAGTSYLRIRVLAAPAVLATMVLQSGLLAQHDSVTCLAAVAAGSALNVVGDVILIGWMRTGLVGAAVATMAGQYLTLAILLVVGYAGRREGSIRLRRGDWGRVTWGEAKPMAGPMLPLFLLATSKNVCYLLMQSLSTSFSTVTCAAHQAVWSVWAIASFVPTPLEQCAQVFLPRYERAERQLDDAFETPDPPADADADAAAAVAAGGRAAVKLTSPTARFRKSREFVRVLRTVGLVVGLVLGVVGLAGPLAPQLLTPDRSLWPIMASFAPYVFMSLSVSGVAIGLDGVLMALDDVGFLTIAQTCNMVLLGAFLYIQSLRGVGILSVWQGLVLFFVLRVVENLWRIRSHMRPGPAGAGPNAPLVHSPPDPLNLPLRAPI